MINTICIVNYNSKILKCAEAKWRHFRKQNQSKEQSENTTIYKLRLDKS